MKYSLNKELITGVAIPVSALRTEKSCGIGEFLDLKIFADWCKSVNIDLIQLLPVNDTGYQSSPYSALSAFALHPIYINIMEIPESKAYEKKFNIIHKKWENSEKVFFHEVLTDKLKLLQKIYKENIEKISNNKLINKWENKNKWIKSYALFSYLKEKNSGISWIDWKDNREPTENDIEVLFESNREHMSFYSWLQYNLELQLISAVTYLESLGINLKGDLPILINVDSADVWSHRDIFNTKDRAGAPPDMFSQEGQNWGFPTYSWETMEKNNFKWWKDRLKQAAKFYHAYRIDHVLGFFRIWTIPSKYENGSMGFYSPNCFLTLKDLENIGLSGERLIWMSKPHIPGHELRESLGIESNEIIRDILEQIGNEDLYLFKSNISTVKDIYNLTNVSDEAKNKLIEFFQNIALMEISPGNFMTTWFYYNSRAYNSLSDHEKFQLSQLLKSKSEDSMKLWEEQGLKLLKFMKESQDMLVCAEDLGTIPQCVPKVLKELGILGLHVTRWSKKYNEYGEPFIKPSEYNYLSVSTPAVHDSSTVRQWWHELSQNNAVSHALNRDWLGNEPSPENIYKLYEALLETSSMIAMFQFQDLLGIDDNLRSKNPDLERINVPGTVNDENWSYRMSKTIESLRDNVEFNDKLSNLLIKRG